MNIIYISQHFPPEIGAAQGRAYEMSKNLVELGHEVSMLTTFPNHKKIYKLFKKEIMDGIKVYRSFRIRDTKKSAFRRLANYFSFMVTSIITGIFLKKPDIVYASTPQLFLGVSGYVLSRIHRTKFVLEIRDLWVDFAEILGQIKNKKLLYLAKRLERFLIKKADLLVVVTNGYKQRLIDLGYPSEKIVVITNGVDPDTLPNRKRNRNSLQIQEDIKNQFVILYAGNIGAAQGLDLIIDVAVELKKTNLPFLFILIGDGVAKETLISKAHQHSLDNIIFLDSMTKEELLSYYDIADLGLVILKNHPLFSITIPSKLFDYMAVNTPILIGVDGEARKIVEEHQIGYFFQPGNKEALIAVLKEAYKEKENLDEMRKRLYPTMEKHFNRKTLARELEQALINLTKEQPDRLHKPFKN